MVIRWGPQGDSDLSLWDLNLGQGHAGPVSGSAWTDGRTEHIFPSFSLSSGGYTPCVIFLYFIMQLGGSRPGREGFFPNRQLCPAWTRAKGRHLSWVLAPGSGWGPGARPPSAALGLPPWQMVILGQEGHSLREGAGGLTSSTDAYLSRPPEEELGVGVGSESRWYNSSLQGQGGHRERRVRFWRPEPP